jgi:hypothetical protein
VRSISINFRYKVKKGLNAGQEQNCPIIELRKLLSGIAKIQYVFGISPYIFEDAGNVATLTLRKLSEKSIYNQNFEAYPY